MYKHVTAFMVLGFLLITGSWSSTYANEKLLDMSEHEKLPVEFRQDLYPERNTISYSSREEGSAHVTPNHLNTDVTNSPMEPPHDHDFDIGRQEDSGIEHDSADSDVSHADTIPSGTYVPPLVSY